MRKKRILLVNEFSLLNTGFGVMGMELFKRLNKTDKYELAELASYVGADDQRIYELPWKVYPVIPAKNDIDGNEKYKREYSKAQFGASRFEDTLLDFRPDIVISHRDFWHDQFITESPFRHLFYYIWSTCIDSEPPQPEWLNTFSKVDCLTSYTQWGLNVLKRYGGDNFANVANIDTMPGVDIDVFKPLDKKEIRRKYGIKEDIIIIMKCARNQLRKLYPDLIRSFMNTMDRLYKDGHYKIADKSFLYLHTSLVDVGWDVINEIKRYNASHKVLLTYICVNCKHVFASFAHGKYAYCQACGHLSAITPNTQTGVSRETLAEIYNLADMYCQVQVAGACEIPLLEARCAGVPTLAVDYAAPHELQKLPGSFGLTKVANYRQESIRETGQFRAYVDNDDLAKKLYKFLRLSNEERHELSKQQRETGIKYHNYDLTAEKWQILLDEAPLYSEERWYEEPNIVNIAPEQMPLHLPNEQFIKWCCESLFPKSHRFRSFLKEKELLMKLSLGFIVDGSNTKRITKQDLVKEILNEVHTLNHFELHRHNILVAKPKLKEQNRVAYKVYS